MYFYVMTAVSINFLAIQGMSTGEEAFAALFILVVLIWGFSKIADVWSIHVEPRDDRIFNRPDKKTVSSLSKKVKKIEYAFDYSMKNNVKLLYYGEVVLYATIVDHKVYFFWAHNSKQAAPLLAYNPERMKAVETVLKTVHKKSLKVLNKRTTGEPEVWDILKPEAEQRSKRSHSLDIEVS